LRKLARRGIPERKLVDQLIEFSKRFEFQPILALKFKGRGKLDLRQPRKIITFSLNYKINFQDASQIGIDLKTLVRGGVDEAVSLKGLRCKE
jgi:Holliday junction resolvase